MSNTLTHFSIQLIRIISPINIILGVTGNSINIIVLTRPTLQNYASTYYFLALAINNLFVSSFILVTNLLADGYEIDISTFSLISCKISRYLSNLCMALSAYFIVLALIDRYCISSLNANRRKLSNVKTARWLIICIIGLFAILYISTPILSDIKTDDGLGCYIRAKSIYYQIYPILQVFIFGVLSPCLMIVFGILAIYNTKRVHLHPVHISHHRRTERQLGFMLLIQVSTYIILNLPLCTVYVMLSFIPLTFLTPEFIFINTIFRLLHQFSYTTPFLLYILSGYNFRKELFTLINRIPTHRPSNKVQPTITHINTNAGDLPIHLAATLKHSYEMRVIKQ